LTERSQKIYSLLRRVTSNLEAMDRRTTAAPLGKEAEMAEDISKKGKPWTGTGRPAPTTTQGKPYLTDRTRAEIEKAAYYRWLNRGRPTGDDWTDWLLAEKEYKTKK
jgi:hypothetical protein